MTSISALLKDLGFATNLRSREVVVLVEALVNHPLYESVKTLQRVKMFMEHQVWCVWDFMCLAKSVQTGVGCYEVPWIPPQNTALVQAANGILAGEEADTGPDGLPASHLEIFIEAMIEAHADAEPVQRFIEALRARIAFESAVLHPKIPTAAREFMSTTLGIASGPLHCRVACFCLTREELVPRMFHKFIPGLPEAKQKMPKFLWYLQRHVELDMKIHGPHSQTLLRQVVGGDAQKIDDAMAAVVKALKARRLYLDATLEAVLTV